MDRFLRPLLRIIEKMVTRQTRYLGLYQATIVAVPEAGQVAIQPADQATFGPGFTCPLWYGVPGIVASWPSGAIGSPILFGFIGGDPTLPYVPISQCINNNPPVTLTVVGGQQATGAQAFSRVGDSITVPLSFQISGGPPPNTLTVTYTPPDGGMPQTAVLTGTTASGDGISSVTGVITSGNGQFLG